MNNRVSLTCLFLVLSCFTVQAGWLDPRFDLPGANGSIVSLLEFRGALYAVGGFTRIAGVDAPGVARWNGTNWQAVEPGLNAFVQSAVATDEAIYFALWRQQLTQPAGLLRWDGLSWTAPGTPPGYRDVLGEAMIANQKEIYVEAFPEMTSGPYPSKALAMWNGTKWFVLADTSAWSASGLNSLAFAGGNIYGSGALQDADNPWQSLNLGRLLAPNWSQVGDGIGEGRANRYQRRGQVKAGRVCKKGVPESFCIQSGRSDGYSSDMVRNSAWNQTMRFKKPPDSQKPDARLFAAIAGGDQQALATLDRGSYATFPSLRICLSAACKIRLQSKGGLET